MVSLNDTRYINSCFTCLLIRWRSGWSLCAYSYNVLCVNKQHINIKISTAKCLLDLPTISLPRTKSSFQPAAWLCYSQISLENSLQHWSLLNTVSHDNQMLPVLCIRGPVTSHTNRSAIWQWTVISSRQVSDTLHHKLAAWFRILCSHITHGCRVSTLTDTGQC